MNKSSLTKILNFKTVGVMARIRPNSPRVWFLAVIIAMTIGASNDAQAIFIETGNPGVQTSFQSELKCLRLPSNPSLATCKDLALFWDPDMVGITGLSMTLQYDPLLYTFDQANSGPLGVFSVGGDAPPPNPGIGTQLVHLLPSSGFTAGAPLPGSTLTYTDVSGLLTVNYELASPITVDSNIDFFRTDFAFVHPLVIDLTQSTITYQTAGPGRDFSLVNFACTTTDLRGNCGSDTPSTGMTFDFAVVPEPSTLALFILGSGLVLGLSVHARRRRTRI